MTNRNETGAVHKQRGSGHPIALVYPNTYRVGMGNLGFQFIYAHLNSKDQFSAERFFLDNRDRSGSLISVESRRKLKEFPVIAFSVPFENDYEAVPGILGSSGIKQLARDRLIGEPLVMAGGVSLSLNPEPLADFLDLVYIGEIDDENDSTSSFLPILAEVVLARSRKGIRKEELLEAFSAVPGVYVPSGYQFRFRPEGSIDQVIVSPGFPEKVKAVKRRSRNSEVPMSSIFSKEAEFGDNLLVEINRGCSRGCRFCTAGWIHFPVRYASYDLFRDRLDHAIASERTAGLIGADLAGHPQLEEILGDVLEKGGKFSLSSIRPEGLTPAVIDFLARSGQKTATLAPEVASAKMKRVIGKEIPSDRFLDLVAKLVTAGIPNVRFYFMIGLPTETDEDVKDIVDFVLAAGSVFLEASRPRKTIGKIGVQVNPFVPKPWTPFQWAVMEEPDSINRKVKIIRDGLGNRPNISVRFESTKEAIIQSYLSRGDRRVGDDMLRASARPGFKLRHRDIDLNRVFRKRLVDEIFPWDTLDHGISKGTLHKIFCKAVDCPNTVSMKPKV